MGYRSNVIISVVATATDFDQRKVLGQDLPDFLLDADITKRLSCGSEKDNAWYRFEWQDSKWYDSYPEVQAVHEWLNSLEPDDYHFHRLGEDFGDYDSEGDYDDNIYVDQSLESF